MAAETGSYRFRRRLAGWIGMAMLVVTCSLYYVWYDYAYTRPRVPRPDQGRIYALNTHGLVVYLTKEEQFRLYLLEGTSIILVVSFALIAVLVIRQGNV